MRYLRRMIQDLGVHTLIRQPPNGFATQVREEVDPVRFAARRAQLPKLIGIQTVLPTYLQASRAEGMRFGSREPFQIFLDDETSHCTNP